MSRYLSRSYSWLITSVDNLPVPDLSLLDSQYIEQNSNLVAFPDEDNLQDSVTFADSQWPDFTGPDLADIWDVLPSQYRFDDFIAVPESLALPEQGEDATGSESNAKRRCRIPPDAKRLLEESFERHKHDPYLQKNDIKELAQATNLSLRQIRTFFANARARKLPPPPSLSNVESGLGGTDEAKRGQTPGPEFMIKSIMASRGQPVAAKKRRCVRDQESQKLLASANIHVPGQTTQPQQDPMERFLSSSPEDEGISEDAIRKAAASLDSNEIAKRPVNERSSSRADAMSVTDTAFSSNSGSASSHASIDSVTNRGPRRGRKRQRDSTLQEAKPFIRKPSHPSKVFQCTFCSTDFAKKYDWRRHEESVHFPQQEWICMPDGPTIQSNIGTSNCAFCDLPNPPPTHFDSHNCSSCLPIPRSERTFTRKDKLFQHLTQVHKQALFLPHMADWCRPIQRDVTIACGICGLRLQTWSTRADHISAHFVDGHSMDLWVSAPGGITPSSAFPEAQPPSAQGLALDNPASSPTAEFQHHHPCSHCAARFTSYVDAVFHERQAHAVYKPRPTAHDRDGAMPKPSATQRGRTGLREEYSTVPGVQVWRRAKGLEPRLKPGGPADMEAGSPALEGFKPVPRGCGKGGVGQGGGGGGKGRLAALVAGEGGTADEAAAAFAPASVVPASFVAARRTKLAGDVRPDLMAANGAPKPSRMTLPGSDGLTPPQQPLRGARSKTVWGPWGLS